MATEPLSLGAVLQIVTALGLVTLLIVGGAWGLRRFGRFQAPGTTSLRMVGGIHLGNRERIVLLQAGDERLVVGVTPGCIRTLHVLPSGPAGEDGDVEAGSSFLSRLHRELARRGPK